MIAVAPGWQSSALRVYLPNLRAAFATRPVSEIDVVDYTGFTPGGKLVPTAPAGFRRIRTLIDPRFTIVEYAAPRLMRINGFVLAPGRTGRKVPYGFYPR